MPGEEGALMDVFGRLSSGKVIRNAPFRFRAKNGEVKYLVVDSNVNFNEDGSFRHTRCFIRNDNERRVREAILETDKRCTLLASKAKDKFIRRIFHEIRTPLHVMSGILNTADTQLLKNDINDLSRNLGTLVGVGHVSHSTVLRGYSFCPSLAGPFLPSIDT
jgi:signal transduction histidine kinase